MPRQLFEHALPAQVAEALGIARRTLRELRARPSGPVLEQAIGLQLALRHRMREPDSF